MRAKKALIALCATVWVAGVGAQQTTPTPTPTPQRTSATTSTPPFVISGCVSALPGAAAGGTVPSQSYSLGRLEYGTSGAAYDQWARTHPMGPATVAPGGRTTAAATPQRPTEFAIGTAPNSAVDLSKYVGQNVQITGTLGTSLPDASAPASGAARSGGGTGRSGTDSLPVSPATPSITVTNVRVLNQRCGG